jgi:hypothetical protein
MMLYDPTLAQRKVINWSGGHGSSATANTADGVAQQSTEDALTGIQFLGVSGGTITGTFRLYGISN